VSHYYNSATAQLLPIPTAACYVLARDPFMSGWGGAEHKTNTIVVPCESYEQADRVVRFIEDRGDMKNIRVVGNMPASRAHVLYSLYPQWAARADAKYMSRAERADHES
jgi:hypothetical protein